MFLDDIDTANASEMRTGYTKWDSVVDLTAVGLPTLNACFIPPYTSEDNIKKAVETFKSKISTPKIMIRSDATKETTDYIRLGVSLPPEEVSAKAFEVSQMGRAVILFPQTSRFASYWSHNTVVHKDGSFNIELMGPGFDGSGLSRGDIKALYSISSKPQSSSLLDYYKDKDWDYCYDEQDSFPFLRLDIHKDPTPADERIELRLQQIAKHILPKMGVKTNNSSKFAERWLKRNGYDFLWTKKDEIPSPELIDTVLKDAAKLCRYLKKEGRFSSATALSGFMIDIDGRKAKNIYLEYFNGKKWGNEPVLFQGKRGRGFSD